MEYSSELGVAAPELSWVPSPTYLLRRAAIFDVLSSQPPGRVLEAGCSVGALLRDLAARGFSGLGVELSPDARAIAERVLADTPAMRVVSSLPEDQPPESFDYLLSFEVLEHIEDDHRALAEWLRLLRPGGLVVVSVPAHRAKWNVTDVLVGHYRRYDREDVKALLRSANLQIQSISTCGFPASWLIEKLRIWAKGRQMRAAGLDPSTLERGDLERSKSSGVDRSMEARFFPYYSSLPGRVLLRLAARAQRGFYGTDWGISYLAVARKPQ